MTTQSDGPIGIVGLGSMGIGMATSLHAAGCEIIAHDIGEARRALAKEAGITVVADVGAIFEASRCIVLSLPNGAIVSRLVKDNLSRLKRAAGGKIVIVDTSTSDPETSRELSAVLADLGHGFLDAPVSGGPAGAASGKLTMMIGGRAEDLDVARAIIDSLCASVLHVGPSGAGNVAKLVNNLLVAAHMITTREGLRLAEAAGVDAASVLKVLNSASGGSVLSKIHFPTWVMPATFDSGFSTALMRKDIGLALKMAEAAAADLPLAQEVARMWTDEPGLTDEIDFTRMGDFRGAATAQEESAK
ncbi:NAD(P)-dependent oxidoreductase [Jiella sp. MQZ9-1]|uniref:NAD(P)-dependent oxidoreductase n=1 Tax=Jiella flava TaxID=2816857 RepID=A0A939FXF7_9HYPH|nr:NAD(P)-dependent oxidoreductase [Jiella flava]MBO0662536.1 NAD(P)-dependent oxidoreductase [Jiella flava]MCD2472907.1 NAD(P)-dependent oxidoreductase [Jiella flava]